MCVIAYIRSARKRFKKTYLIFITFYSRSVLLLVFALFGLRVLSLLPPEITRKMISLPILRHTAGLAPSPWPTLHFYERFRKALVMSYMFYNGLAVTLEQKIAETEHDIQRFSRAWQSPMARPVDYINLIDAQFALRSLKDAQ